MNKNKFVKLYKENLHKISGGDITITDYYENDQIFIFLNNQGVTLFNIKTVLSKYWKEKAAYEILNNFYGVIDDEELYPAVDNWLGKSGYCRNLKTCIKKCIVIRALNPKTPKRSK